MSKQRVMDDLDALLADLQSTTSHVGRPEVPTDGYNHASTGNHDDVISVEMAIRSTDVQTQSVKPMSHVSSAQKSPSMTSQADVVKQETVSQRGIGVTTVTTDRHVSSLSSNLSELDSLLQELSSAQFSVELDRRNAGTPGSQGDAIDAPFDSHPQRVTDNVQSSVDNGLPVGRQVSPTSGASTATRELDELMASLSGMSVVEKTEAPNAVPIKSTAQLPITSATPIRTSAVPSQGVAGVITTATTTNHTTTGNVVVDTSKTSQSGDISLNAMMEDLDKNMSKQGVTTVPKGHCAACAKPIVGQVITALGRLWHPEHFTCVHCQLQLGTRNFFERDSLPYCEQDYHSLFSPRCAACNGPVLDKCVTALDKTWHPEHFCCAKCGRQLGEEDGFHERDNNAYCRDDFFDLYAPKCGGCSRAIIENYITALSCQWHPECFVCFECHVPFGVGSFFDHEGLPYCETHFHAKRGSLCAGCRKPITGRCITAMYKKFHPEHFVCTFCQKQLNKGTFKEQNDKPYCHPCFVRLFS